MVSLRYWQKFWVMMILLAAAVISGCQQDSRVKTETASRILIDDLGNEVVLSASPQRIVSLNLGTDEILLGLVADKRIAALSRYARDPGLSFVSERAVGLPCIHDYNAEAIVALQPELVLMSDSVQPEVRQVLHDLKIPVYISQNPQNVAEARERVRKLAELLDAADKGREIISSMDEKLCQTRQGVSKIPPERRRTAIAYGFSGPIGRAGGMFDDMCIQAGVINGAAELGLKKNQSIAKEQIVLLDPDVFLLPDWSSNDDENQTAFKQELMSDAAFATVKAVKDRRLLSVPDKYRYCTSQSVAEGVLILARTVYPEYFSE